MNRGKLILGAWLCVASVMAVKSGWDALELREPGFHERSCWFDEEAFRQARCGIFTVRENRQKQFSRTIRLPVVILEAPDKSAPKAPILYVTGGPGGQAYLGEDDFIAGWREEQALFPPGHDLIVMGQRGTGLDEADFDCPEFQPFEVSLGAYRRDGTPPDRRALLMEAAADCAERLTGKGIDLTAYNSRESAADIAELRLALGIPEWTLYGISYGTRLVLSTLRYHPEGVRSVILDSVFPPQASNLTDLAAFYRAALERLFRACADDESCTRVHGDLAQRYEQARAKLREEPLLFRLSEVEYRSKLVLPIDDQLFDFLIYDSLYDGELRKGIPELLRATAVNVDRFLINRVREYLSYESLDSSAVYLSHICHDETPFEDPAAIAAAVREAGPLGHLITESWDGYLCEAWPAGRAAPVEATPVDSPVPALLLSGAFDPITRAPLARAAAAHLPNGHAFELADSGHGVLYQSPCAQRLTAAFLADPWRRPLGVCPPERFIAEVEARAAAPAGAPGGPGAE